MKDGAHHMKGVQRKVLRNESKLNGKAVLVEKNTPVHEVTLRSQRERMDNPRASVKQKRLPIY